MRVEGCRGARLLHNTIRVEAEGAVEIIASEGVVLVNNLLNTQPLISNAQGPTSWTHDGNIFQARDEDFEGPNSFHLVGGDPAIGAGTSTANVDHDIEGEPREGRFDVGCDQF